MTSYNVTGLAPDTKYTIQVAALTRRGDGTRSQPAKVKTPGGVPSRPNITPRYLMKNLIEKSQILLPEILNTLFMYPKLCPK